MKYLFKSIICLAIWIPFHLVIAVPTKSISKSSNTFDKSELDSIFGPDMHEKPLKQMPVTLENIPELTQTQKSCYVTPPPSNLTDMNFIMGLWNTVRKIQNIGDTNYRYICEKAVYTPTGPNTFNKVANIHFHKKWLTLTANGTFVPPGTFIIDYRVSDIPNRQSRFVFTVLGADASSWIVGYNCRYNSAKPELVLQTRNDLVPLASLNKAYSLMNDDNLSINDMVCQDGF